MSDGTSGQRGASQPNRPSNARASWPAAASSGKLVGALIVAGFALLALAAFQQFRGSGGEARPLWFVLVLACAVAAVGAGYLLSGIRTMRYVFDGDTLVVIWIHRRRVIRLTDIVDVVDDPRAPVPERRWEWFWPGYYVSTRSSSDCVWRSVATRRPRQCVRVVTPGEVALISPARPIPFIEELVRRREEAIDEINAARAADPFAAPRPATLPAATETGSARRAAPSRQPVAPPRQGGATPAWSYAWRRLFREELLGDHVASALIAIGVIVPLLMAAWLFGQYEGLRDQVPLHWDAAGDVDRVGRPRALWWLPVMATLILAGNTTLATLLVAVDRFLARLLLAATPIAQATAFIALIRLMR